MAELEQRKTWTDEQKEHVCVLWCAGASMSEMTQQFGVRRGAIIGLAFRGKWKRGKIIRAKSRAKSKKSKILSFAPNANPVTFLELTNSTCRWPLGEFNERAEFYCGAAADNAQSPYCTFHQHIALVGSAAIFPSDAPLVPPDYAAVKRKSSLNSRAATRKVA